MRRPAVVSFAAALLASGVLRAATVPIDPARSTVTVHVFKSGILSAFGDDHDVRAPVASGTIDEGPSPSVTLEFDAASLTVLDPALSAGKRAEVQKRMEGPEVLDVARYPRIRFRSTKVEARGAHRWLVEGPLELHGRSAPVSFEVTESEGVFRGAATLGQRAFGIEPIRVAGGTVRVKNELRIDFAIAPVRGAAPGSPPAR